MRKTMNILLVEDNEADRRAVQEAFLAVCNNATLHMVESGDEALRFIFNKEEFQESPIVDLVLLDLNLPGIHGRDVLRELKTSAEKKNVPVIVLTSSTAQYDICESYNLSANCYVNKPMRYAELLDFVKLVCDFWIKQVQYCVG
jgi:two-component system, chemotaxis family, response regulator Rcp1